MKLISKCLVLLAVMVIPLGGCVPALIYDYMIRDVKGEFESWANRIIGTTHNMPYLPGNGGSPKAWGYGILQSSEDRGDTVDYTYRQLDACYFAITVIKQSRVISAWRYVGKPENCWIHKASP